MYKKTLQSVKNPLHTEVDSVNTRQPHFIFSAENPRYPVKYNLDHQGVQDLLAKKGYRFDVIQGHYGKPEQSILVHNPSKHAVRYLQNLAQGLGQESSIYSDGYNHEMHFHGGEHTGQHLKGQGTNFHKRPPQDYFSTLKDGTTFTHSFDMENYHESEMSKLKPEGYVKKSEDNLTLIHYSPNQGLKSISPNFQGNRIKDSSSKHGRPEHPVSFFYRQDSPTEDLVTQGSQSKYHVQTQNSKLYDIGHDKDNVYQHLKSSGQTLNPGIVTRDELHGELKKRGFHGFYNSQHDREDMRGVVGLYHETPVVHEESLDTIQKAINSPSKHIGLDRLKQIKSDNHIGAGGKEYSEDEVGHAINERQTNVANKMVAGASKQEKLRAQNEENAAKGIGGALPTDFPWMNAKPKAADKGSDNIRKLADTYAATKGIKLQHKMPPVKVDPTRAKRIADAYHQANHEPQAQHVQQAYQALIGETNDQFKHILNSGLKISKIKPGQDNPYKSSKDLFHDLHNNNHIWYFPTESGFGSGQADTSHPMLQPTEHMHEGQPMAANDVFRIVHDYFGHAKEGHGFGAEGEENAWKNHMQMYSPMAQKALTAETRGQNSWVNYGPHGEENRKNPANTKYADQKATVLPDWASDSEHHSIYKQLGNLKKREVIMKGAMNRLAPFNPDKNVSQQDHDATENWTMEGVDQDARQNVPEIHANAKIRALHKLSGKTQVRRHPKTGERMFLLHRGMAESEFQTNHINGIANYAPNSFTSWTPSHKVASGFANDHLEHLAKNPRVVSAWIPESHIHNVPNQVTVPDESKQFRTEHEVIVNHKGKFPHAHPKVVELVKEPRKDLNQKINLKAQAKQSETELPNAWENDHKRMVQRQQRAEDFKRKKFGKREAVMLKPLQKGDVSNKIKSGIAGLAIAAGTLAPMDTSKQTQTPQPTPPQVVAPAPPTKKDRVLSGIKFIESSGGKFTDHQEMKSGMFKGDKAYGSYGLMPVVIRETIKRHPTLMQVHSAALGLSGKDFHDYMDQNPKLEHIIASKHYDHITRALGENPMKIGYAWLNGIQGTKNAVKANKPLKDHHYVQKLMNQLHPPVKKPLGPNSKK